MDSGWRCNVCTLNNSCSDLSCAVCKSDRPTPSDAYGASKHVESEWNCSVCTFLNKGCDDVCHLCRNPKVGGACALSHVQQYAGQIQTPYNADYTKTDELRIVIIGRTGNGKSATGNNILGIRVFESKACGGSITKKCQLGINARFNRRLIVVDTPGLYDTHMTNEEVTIEMVKCIGMTAPGPHAFLLTVSLASRFTDEETNTFKEFVDHFGNGMYTYLIIVFTRADNIENEGISIDEYLSNAPASLRAILHLCGNRYIAFNNKLEDHRQDQQVQALINMIDVQVQTNGGSCYTNEMWEEAENTLQRREKEMKRKLIEEETRKVETIRRNFQIDCDRKIAAVNKENERLENQIREAELERQKEGTLTQQTIDQIAALQKQIEENERNRQKEIDDLKRENEKKVKDLEEKRQLELATLRDISRRGCEQETDVLSQIFSGIGGFVKHVWKQVKKCVIS